MTSTARLRTASASRPVVVQVAVTVVLGVVISLGSAAAGLLPTAAAQSELVSSSPAAASRAAVPPTQVRLAFTDDVTPDFATITLSVDKTPEYNVPTRAEKFTVYSTTASAATKPLPEWKIAHLFVSNDGHRITFPMSPTTPPNSRVTPTRSPTPAPPSTTPPKVSPGSRINYPVAIIPVAILALAILGPAVIAARRRKEQAAQATTAKPKSDVPTGE